MAPSGGAPNTPPNGPPPSEIQLAPNQLGFDPKQAVPQQPLYLQRNDYIGFQITSNITNCTVRINYRFLTPDGQIKEGELNVPPFTSVTLVDLNLYEGWLLSFSALVTSGNTQGQWAFMQALLFRVPVPSPLARATAVIWQGFLYFNGFNGWPGNTAKEITDGPGKLRFIQGSTPAAGSEINETVPVSRRWTLLSFLAALSTSAAVANRFPRAQITNGANTLYQIGSSFAQVASTVLLYNLAPGNQFYTDTNGDILIPFPTSIQLKSNWKIQTNTVGLQAADQWSSLFYVVQEWGDWDL